ncbi:MAG: ABC transporter ATP-binding protein/permease [Acetatifactor sp.]|nr:ABC transporter ATP-binding protein/permease [Acetatifactor sp.]
MKKKESAGSTLLWLSKVAGKAKLHILILLLIQAILAICGVAYAMLLRRIINTAVAGDRNAFFIAIGSFAALIMSQIVLRALNRFLEENTRSTLENRFKSRLFQALLTKDYQAVAGTHSGEWMNRLTSDTVVVADGLQAILPGVTGMTVKMLGATIAIIWLEPRFLYILVPGGILMILISYLFRRSLKRLHRNIQEADGKLRVHMSERLSSMVVIRSFSQEKNTVEQADELMANHKEKRIQRNHFSNICNIAFSFVMDAVYVLGAFFCGYNLLQGSMSYGDLMAILQLVAQIQNPFASITGYLPKFYAMLASAERLMEAELFADDRTDEQTEAERRRFYDEKFVSVGLRDASFTYRPLASEEPETMGTVALTNLNIEVGKGEYVAFTGPSGCGKSTAMKLLMALYSLDSGEQYLKTVDGEMPLRGNVRGLFAYVPQGNQLLSGSIREIIAFGDREKMQQEEKLQEALRIACAEEFVQNLEKGLDTVLGERGTGLSEGQMQRIAIARAIFSEHPILLLDEATSSLDEATEQAVLANLRRMTDRTVMIVTHRPAVLTICDKEISFGKK